MVRTILLLSFALLLVLIAGCESNNNNTNTLTEAESRARIQASILEIAGGISTEELERATQYVSNLFVLQPEIASKFNVGSFSGSGQAAFATFFEKVISAYGDIALTIDVQSLDIDGNLATANVHVSFSGQRTTDTPPTSTSFSFNAVLLFEFKNGQWKLINFGPATGGHNEGGGNSF